VNPLQLDHLDRLPFLIDKPRFHSTAPD
jgi:hypothetical protein